MLFCRYRLDQVIINGRIKDALTELTQTHPHIKAVIMGTRHSDPFSGESHNNESSVWKFDINI